MLIVPVRPVAVDDKVAEAVTSDEPLVTVINPSILLKLGTVPSAYANTDADALVMFTFTASTPMLPVYPGLPAEPAGPILPVYPVSPITDPPTLS